MEAKGAAVILDKMSLKTSDLMKAITNVTSNRRYLIDKFAKIQQLSIISRIGEPHIVTKALRFLGITSVIARANKHVYSATHNTVLVEKSTISSDNYFRFRENCAKLSSMMQDASSLADLLAYQVRRAAKLSRKRFQLSPKEPIHLPISSYLEVFIVISIALVTVAS